MSRTVLVVRLPCLTTSVMSGYVRARLWCENQLDKVGEERLYWTSVVAGLICVATPLL